MKLPISILATGSNGDLPPLAAWRAASFWAQVLLILSVALNALGVDLFGILNAMGFGGTPDEVVATGERAVGAVQQLLPLVFGLWAWLERQAPRFRLTFWGK